MEIIKKTIIGALALAQVLSFCGCTKDSSIIAPDTPSKQLMKITLNASQPTKAKQRITITDGIDTATPTFVSEWEKGDSMRVYDQSTHATGVLYAQSAGRSVEFDGTMSNVNTGDVMTLVSGNATINTTDGTAAFDITHQKGSLNDLGEKGFFYGTTTATVADNQITLAACTVDKKLAIVRFACYFTDQAAATLAAFSASSAQATINKLFSCNLTTGELTPTASTADDDTYLRATFDNLQAPTAEVHNGTTYYVNHVYMTMLPGQFPADLVVNAYSRGNITYKTALSLGSTLTLNAGDVQPINVNYTTSDVVTEPAISCPGFEFSMSPGLVYAYRNSTSDAWSYKFLPKQGDVATALSSQSDLGGCYFVWGSVDPTEVFHYYNNTHINAVSHTTANFQDVSSLCGDHKWKMLTKVQAEALMAVLDKNNKTAGSYTFTDENGTQQVVYGMYLGTSTQPSVANQDDYFFFPSTGDLYNKHSTKQPSFPASGTFNGYKFLYGTSPTYSDATAQNRQISFWTSTYGSKTGQAYRIQYNTVPTTQIPNDVETTREVTFGRVVRGVRY